MQCWVNKMIGFLAVGCFMAFSVGAQPVSQKTIDSILTLPYADTVKIKLLVDRSQQLTRSDSAKSMELALAGLNLSEKSGNKEWIAQVYNRLGGICFVHKNYKNGGIYYDKALKIAGEDYPAISAKVYTAYAWAYEKQGLFNKSVENYQKALEATRISKDKNKEAGILNAMGALFFHNKQYSDCIRYQQRSLDVAVMAGSQLSQLTALEGIVITYITLYKKSQPNPLFLDSAQYYINVAEELLASKFDMRGNNHLEPVLLVYSGELFFLKKDYSRATEKALLAINKAQPFNIEDVVSKSYMLMSRIYYAQQKFTEATSYQRLGEGILISSSDPVVLKEAYEEMIFLFLERKDTASAFVLQEKLSRLNDSVFTQDKARAINMLQIEYETAEKEFTIKDLKRTNQFIATASVLGLGLLLLVIRGYRLRRKLLLQEQRALQEENQKIIFENKIKEETNEKLRLAQQLEKQENLRKEQEYESTLVMNQLKQEQLQQQVDSKYRELTAQMVQMEKRNEVLLQIKSDLIKVTENKGEAGQSGGLKNTLKVIDQNLNPDDDFDNFRLHFENVHPHFFVRLMEKSDNQLSQLDIKHCAYIKMNFGTKEIANLLNVEAKSIRMARYRLKQKLCLEKDVDLLQFINSL
jgi:hypothetical protein